MMGWASFIAVNLIGIGSNFDNTGVGLAYGSDKIKIPHWVNAISNVVGGTMALLGAFIGDKVAIFMPATMADWFACIALCGIGMFFLYAAYIHPRLSKQATKLRIPAPGLWQGILLGLVMSLDNVILGFGSTVSGTASLWVSAISIALWGYVMLWLGHVLGYGIFAKFVGKYSSFVSGILLIAVGMYQVYG